MWQLFVHSSLFIKLILIVLSSLSMFSWGIILYKFLQLRAASQASTAVLDVTRAGPPSRRRSALVEAAQAHEASPLAAMVAAASAPHAARSADGIRDLLAGAQAQEFEKLQSYLIFLATTGATAPFIGLLGTVIGIMDAFRSIAAAESASLAVVAPAIAEALIATAAGLAAAIPAVMAYNVFVNWVRKLNRTIESSTSALQALLRTEDA